MLDTGAASSWLTCRVPHPDAPGLGDLVGDPAPFTSDGPCREVIWSPGAAVARDPGRFATADALWDDVLSRHVRTPTLRMVRDGATLPASQFCRTAGVGAGSIDDVIQPNRVIELHRGGATVVLQGLQFTDPHLGRFANNLALALDHPVQINAYLSPVAAKGLELHFDFHDVFVVQIAGRKRWRVWPPLDRTQEPVRGGPPVSMPTFDELGEPLLDLTLVAGDCLYLPRGFPHSAQTIESASGHLTVGVKAITWQRVVRRAVDAAVAAGELRTSLPSLMLDPSGPVVTPTGGVLDAHLDATEIRSWLAEEIWHHQPATRRMPLSPPSVRLDDVVAVTPGPLLWLTSGTVAGRVTLGLGERNLDLPDDAHDFLGSLLASPEGFVAADWAGDLDPSSRLVVLDRLAAEGLIRHG